MVGDVRSLGYAFVHRDFTRQGEVRENAAMMSLVVNVA